MAINLETIQQWAARRLPSAVRSAALTRLQEIGWPRSRNEAWTFFPLSLFSGLDLPAQAPSDDPPGPFTEPSLLDLAQETDIAALLPLVLGLGTRQYWLHEGTISQDDLALALQDPFSHTVLRLGASSKVRLLLPRTQDEHAFKAQRIDIFCAAGSELELISTGENPGAQLGLRHVNIVQEEGSRLNMLALHSGGSAYRGSLRIKLNGTGSSCAYRALSLLAGQAHSHRNVRIVHAAPGCQSEQFVRQILTGSSQASYDGAVHVERGSTGTVSHQLVNSLLLSAQAKASTKPVLKIYHDDVECTHGSTCSDLSPESMFYLESRGVSAVQSRRMLTAAFAAEIVLAHPESPARASFQDRLHHELATLLSL